MNKYPPSLLNLIAYFKKLPGVGQKTAERYAFDLLGWPKDDLSGFGHFLEYVQTKIHPCNTCGCLVEEKECHFCDIDLRDTSSFCIVASPRDVFTIEATGAFSGMYHVLGALLSPLQGNSVEDLELPKLDVRLKAHPVKEVLLALDATLEGDATALYLKEHFLSETYNISKLALGLPMGSSLDFVDGSTLAQAIKGRQMLGSAPL